MFICCGDLNAFFTLSVVNDIVQTAKDQINRMKLDNIIEISSS